LLEAASQSQRLMMETALLHETTYASPMQSLVDILLNSWPDPRLHEVLLEILWRAMRRIASGAALLALSAAHPAMSCLECKKAGLCMRIRSLTADDMLQGSQELALELSSQSSLVVFCCHSVSGTEQMLSVFTVYSLQLHLGVEKEPFCELPWEAVISYKLHEHSSGSYLEIHISHEQQQRLAGMPRLTILPNIQLVFQVSYQELQAIMVWHCRDLCQGPHSIPIPSSHPSVPQGHLLSGHPSAPSCKENNRTSAGEAASGTEVSRQRKSANDTGHAPSASAVVFEVDTSGVQSLPRIGPSQAQSSAPQNLGGNGSDTKKQVTPAGTHINPQATQFVFHRYCSGAGGEQTEDSEEHGGEDMGVTPVQSLTASTGPHTTCAANCAASFSMDAYNQNLKQCTMEVDYEPREEMKFMGLYVLQSATSQTPDSVSENHNVSNGLVVPSSVRTGTQSAVAPSEAYNLDHCQPLSRCPRVATSLAQHDTGQMRSVPALVNDDHNAFMGCAPDDKQLQFAQSATCQQEEMANKMQAPCKENSSKVEAPHQAKVQLSFHGHFIGQEPWNSRHSHQQY